MRGWLALFSMALLGVAALTAACGGDDGGGGPFIDSDGGPTPTEVTNQDGDDDGGGNGGGSSGSTTEGCLLRMTLSGGVEKDIDWDDEVDCAGLGFAAEGVDLGFVYNEDDRTVLINFQVGELEAGETGTDATLNVVIAGEIEAGNLLFHTTSDGGCMIEITEHELVSDETGGAIYNLRGEGTCTEPATPVQGEPILVTDFEIAGQVVWLD